jgi:hypothetical protein
VYRRDDGQRNRCMIGAGFLQANGIEAWGVLSSLSRLLSIRMTNEDGFHRLSSSSGGINTENLIMFCHE